MGPSSDEKYEAMQAGSRALEGKDWRHWSIEDWNRAFFYHFFVDRADASRPVETIHISGSVWGEIVDDPEAGPASIRNAFLEAIQREPRRFRAAYSTDRLDEKNEWFGEAIPPFVVDLIFTCLVATKPQVDGETELNFRERVRLFMEHPEGTYYQFDGLSPLWEAFKRWLDRRREDGLSYRRLELPDRGSQNLIGYSTKLAVPEWRDQRRLSSALDEKGVDEPSVRQVLAAVADGRQSFSKRFKRLFKDFRDEYRAGSTSWSDHPFWTAVEKSTSLAWNNRSRHRSDHDIRVVYESDSISHRSALNLYSTGETDELGEQVSLEEREVSAGTMWYRVQLRVESNGGSDSFAPEELVEAAGDLAPPALKRGVDSSVLLFARNEYGIRELQNVRPKPGTRTWALTGTEFAGAFSSLFDRKSVDTQQSSFDGWALVGPFRFEDVLPHASWPRRLANVPVLQPTGREHSVHLREGVRTGDGFLGTKHSLPLVSVEDVDRVVLKGPLNRENNQVIELESQTGREEDDLYRIPEESIPLSGEYSIRAYVGGTLTSQREVIFSSGLVAAEYKRPSRERDWMVEGGSVDMAVLEELKTESGYPPVLPARDRSQKELSTQSVSPSPPSVQSGIDVSASSCGLHSAAKAIERLGAMGIRRKGIREGEFLDFIDEMFADVDYKLKWDIARSWVETGYVDRLTKRSWKTRKYFPRRPELVYEEVEEGYAVTLVGLSPEYLRNQLRNVAEELGASERRTLSFSNYVAPPLSWKVDSKEVIGEMADRVDIGSIRALGRLPKVARNVTGVSSVDRGEEPLHYSFSGAWSWRLGEFRPDKDHNRSLGTDVKWYQRRDAPDYFRIEKKGKPLWWTYSRNWALLVAHALQDVQPFSVDASSKRLVRTGKSQVYIPVSTARWLAVHSGHSPGPIENADGANYGYGCGSSDVMSKVVSLLWERHSELLERRLRWVLRQATSSRPGRGTRCVQVPSDIIDMIRGSNLDVDIRERRQVPLHLVPHLRVIARTL